MSDQGCLICFVSDFPGQKSARFHQAKWKIAKPGRATIGAPFFLRGEKAGQGSYYCSHLQSLQKDLLEKITQCCSALARQTFQYTCFFFGAHQKKKQLVSDDGCMIFHVLTSRQMSQMERHLRMLAKLGLRSTDLLLNTEIQAMLPGAVRRVR